MAKYPLGTVVDNSIARLETNLPEYNPDSELGTIDGKSIALPCAWPKTIPPVIAEAK